MVTAASPSASAIRIAASTTWSRLCAGGRPRGIDPPASISSTTYGKEVVMQKLPLFLRMLLRRSRKGPPARYDVQWRRAVPVPAADGVSLLTDHYAPVTGDRVPTVMMRAPYI